FASTLSRTSENLRAASVALSCSMKIRLSDSFLERPVLPAVEDQRLPLAGREVADFAGDDHVVAGGDHVAQLAGDPDEGAVDRGDAVPFAPVDSLPLVGDGRLGREAAGYLLLAGVQDADAEVVGGLDGEQRARAAIEAGEHQHRLDRERA